MNFLNTILGFWNKTRDRVVYRFGTQPQTLETNGVTGQPEKIATVFTCCRILSDNLSRMPLSVFLDNDNGNVEMKRHRLTYLLKHQPNSYQNAQQFWSTIEYHRNYYGNGFARVYKDRRTSYPTSLEIIHPGYIKEYYFENGLLYYVVINPRKNTEEDVPASNMLHFRGLSEDGIIGLSPMVAIERQSNINERLTSTLDNFYKNNATSPLAITSDIPGQLGGPAAGVLKESIEQFEKTNAGPNNAGKPMRLPLGHKIQSIAMQFADAKLIETLKFSREDISAAYGVLLGMVDGSFEKMDVEQLTTLFENNTMGPIVAIYMAEINSKLLTRDELSRGFTVKFDVRELIGMAFQRKVNAWSIMVKNGLASPNEGAKALGNKAIKGKYANYHFVQQQNISLEEYDLQSLKPNENTQQNEPQE
jgi:HK97 family phage portal protein